MNRTLRILRNAVMVALFAAVVAGSALAEPMQSKGGEPTTEKSNLSRMADHIEIMRILVAKSINEGAFSARYAEAAKTAREQMKKELAAQLENKEAAPEADARLLRYYNTVAGNTYSYSFGDGTPTFTSHTRGFYATGVGVLFTTEVSVPGRLIEREPTKEPVEPQTKPDDAWQQAAREVQGRDNPLFLETRNRAASKSDRVWEIDSAYVDDAINGVIASVSKYGLRIADLPDGESIIVAIRFEGEQAGYGMNYSLPGRLSVNTVRAAQMEGELAAVAGEEPAVAAAAPSAPSAPSPPSATTFWSNGWSSSWRERRQHVVIEVPKSLIKQFAAGSMSVAEVRSGATITRYSADGDDDDSPFPALAPMAR